MQDEKELTTLEWLEKLPEPFKSKALENARDALDEMRSSLSSAIYNGFNWKTSPEGEALIERVKSVLGRTLFPAKDQVIEVR